MDKVPSTLQDKLQEERIKILYEAIKDTQNVIARLDTKARFYLAIYFVISGALLSGLFTIFKMKLYQKHELLFIFASLITLALLCYLIYLTIITIDKVISPKSNPFEKIESLISNEIYYITPDKRKTTIFFPIADNKSKITFNFDSYREYLKKLDDLSKIEDLLLLELLKVSAIREEKIENMKKIENHLKCILKILMIITVVGNLYFFYLVIKGNFNFVTGKFLFPIISKLRNF